MRYLKKSPVNNCTSTNTVPGKRTFIADADRLIQQLQGIKAQYGLYNEIKIIFQYQEE